MVPLTSTCWASVRGTTARFTALDACCSPKTAVCGKVTTAGFISVKITQELDAASVVKVKNAADQICVYDPGCDAFLDLSVEIELCQVNPTLLNLISGQSLVLDYAGNAVGIRKSSDQSCATRFALEVWTQVPGASCVGTPPVPQYGYFLVPCLRSAILSGDITINSTDAVTLTLTAKTTVPSGWGVGPQTADNAYKVVALDSSNTPGYLLSAIGSTDHDHIQLTTIAPPAITGDCGCQAVTITGSPGVPQISRTVPGGSTTLATAGGKAIEILGVNFTGATAVTFGGVAATNFVVADDTHIEAVYPAKTAGTYPVIVTTPGGTSNSVSVIYA